MTIKDAITKLLTVSGNKIDQKDVAVFLSGFYEAEKNAKEKGEAFLVQNNASIQQALLDLSEKKIDEQDFAHLLEMQKINAEQWINTLSIQKQVKAKQISIDLLIFALKLAVKI